MKQAASLALVAMLAGTPFAASARGIGTIPDSPAATGQIGGRAPWSYAWQYDSNSGNDRRPELPAYQQGGGQQTGGPARNLLPDDGLQIFPR